MATGQSLNKVQKEIFAEYMVDRKGIRLTGVNDDVRGILEMRVFYDTLDIE